jgi:hypothetical protein
MVEKFLQTPHVCNPHVWVGGEEELNECFYTPCSIPCVKRYWGSFWGFLSMVVIFLSLTIDLHNFGHIVQSLAKTCLFGVSI